MHMYITDTNVCRCTNKFFVTELILSHTHACTRAHTHTHTHTQPCNGLLSGTTRVGRYQKKHSPTWSSDILYHLPPFTTIHGILCVQFTCLTVRSDNLSPGLLWSWTLYFILHAFLHPVIIIFSQHMPIPMQPVLLQYQCYVIYLHL